MKNLFDLIVENKNINPSKTYVADKDKKISYLDLYHLVCSFNSYFKKRDIHNKNILVLVSRNVESVISFLGIGCSDNVYVPVDNEIPEEKLSHICKAADIQYYFSFLDRRIDNLSYLDYQEVCTTDEIEPTAVDLKHCLYMMFTSGSTGMPKGVLKSHENIMSFIQNFKETFTDINDVILANQTPFSFDASSKDIYLTLIYHGSMFIPPKETFVLPMNTINYLNDNKINFISWVPSQLVIIAKTRTLNYIKPQYLKYVFFVGEVFPIKYLNMWIDALPSVRFINLYGSTEIAGVALYYEVKEKMDENSNLPTGKPLKNNEVKLIDSQICISSLQVAMSYLDTNKNEDTFKIIDGKRYLLTGDYASLDNEGNIVFSSRKDFQIKHMGYRIELQEIEAHINSLPYIDSCCCLYDSKKEKIVLFVALNSEIMDATHQILNDAKKKMASYMLPNKIIILDKIPLNNNGKIDRNKLKEML